MKKLLIILLILILTLSVNSAVLASPPTALQSIKRLDSYLQELDLCVGRVGFGTHKTLQIQNWTTFAHPGDVAFRDSRFLTSPENSN